ncbi:hypothetical protein DFP93_109107 [Aneurinibacillus soli]|uniref:Uncharacterized protein n=1 Tax=Aneurinibacillus soli TaxID=1500254 RepID=A0A0U5AVI8_9BACL|nr:hypothetical protein DFP93_109107 [Aneurinibacillus soli]BAU27765.1 hypothetical protein CB4_01939 [Aneurinibacillus soli]
MSEKNNIVELTRDILTQTATAKVMSKLLERGCL